MARRRGRRIVPWFVFGALAWFVAIPWLFLTRSRLPEGQAVSSGMMPLAIVALCGAAVLVRVDFSARRAMLPPNCDTYLGVTDLKDFVAQSPAGKASGLEMKTLTDIKEVSRSATELNCTAIAHMNTAAAVPIAYRFTLKDGQRVIEAHWQ
ncbi:MAG: hypothetical protein ABI192_21580 [Bradyrhizobium sp.]